MAKKRKWNATTLLQLFTFIFFAALGGFSAFFELRYFGQITLRYYFYSVAIIVTSLLLHVFLHEIGHILAGLASGYEFIMFRFFNHLWIYTQQGLSKRKEYTPGILGQALMVPPPPNKRNERPVLLYHSGGLLMNGLTALLFIWLGLRMNNPLVRYTFYLSAIIALFLLVTNAIPTKGTDGYNIHRHLTRESPRDDTITMLYLYRDMVKGVPFQQLQKNIPVDDLEDFSVPHTSTFYSLKASAYLEVYDFDKAHAIHKLLWDKIDVIVQAHKADVTLNYFFTLLLTNPTHPDVETIRKTKLYASYRQIKLADSYRVFATEILYLDQNNEKALELLSLGEKEIPFAPTVSDENLERILYAYLKKEANQ